MNKGPTQHLKNQSGQLLVEAVLLLAIGISIAAFTSKYLQDNQFAQKLIAKPWDTLSGMIECGVWSGCAPDKHPNSRKRYLSYAPRGN